jgi:two-component system cell cycle response regulator
VKDDEDELLKWQEDEPIDADRTVIKDIEHIAIAQIDRQAYLMVISGSAAGKMFLISKEPMIVGRSTECDIYLDDEGLSRKHAQIEHDERRNVVITDLDSTNGSYFNGSRITRHFLQDGDKIQLGSTTILKFSYQDSLDASFQEQQYHQATRDGLTQIYNKKFFLEHFGKQVSFALRHNEITSLIIFDIDDFKAINDTYGHPAGDMVLRELAKIVSKRLRTEDLFARFGGEEFVIVLRDLGPQQAHVLAERIRRMVEVFNFMWENKAISVTISLGVATLSSANFLSAEEMMKVADDFLYKAKRDGRNRVASALR